MLTATVIACLFVLVVAMAVLTVLYKIYEEPLHRQERPDDAVLVERAKRDGDHRLN